MKSYSRYNSEKLKELIKVDFLGVIEAVDDGQKIILNQKFKEDTINQIIDEDIYSCWESIWHMPIALQ
ncbi:MAG TPA: hypothetical protein VIJ95_08540 [Hanamia sp.]